MICDMQKERITVTLDPNIVARIDRLAEFRDQSRSKTMESLLELAVEEAERTLDIAASPVIGPIVQSIMDHPKLVAMIAKTIGEKLDPEELERLQDAGPRLRKARSKMKDERGRRYDLRSEGA